MRTFFASLIGGFFALILFVGLFALVIGGVVGAAASKFASSSESNNALSGPVVLSYDMRGQLSDQAPTGGFEAFLGAIGHVDILTLLKAAETDDKVQGLYIRMAEGGVGLSRAEELSASIKSFKAAGKWVLAHSQGSWSVTSPSNLLAISAADEVWMQPGTEIFTTGLTMYTDFYGGLLENIDVSAEFVALHEYKNAPNSYTEKGFTATHEAQMQGLIDSLWSQSLSQISTNRGVDESGLRTALLAGPVDIDAGKTLGLVDSEYWPEEAADEALSRAGEGAKFVDFADYKKSVSLNSGSGVNIAIVGGEGGITTGRAGNDLFGNSGGFKSDTVSQNLLDAGADESVDAIVFRVDSPGGSATASDQIWRAVERVQAEYDKPVIVSMGAVAASGGYYVSAGADKIVANGTTITGSIGIFGGKLAIKEGLKRIGVNAESLHAGGGDLANIFGPERFTQAERKVMYDFLERGYDRFIGIVSDGREIDVTTLDSLARGRVWTGAQALGEDGVLIDEVGTLIDAIELAAQLAGAKEDASFPNVTFYPSTSPEDFINDLLGVSGGGNLGQNIQGLQQLNVLVQTPQFQQMMADFNRAQNSQNHTAHADIPRLD